MLFIDARQRADERAANHLVQVEGRGFGLVSARIHARKLEQVVHQPGKPLRFGDDHAQKLRALLWLGGAIGNRLQIALHAHQRRAQFVRHVGHEFPAGGFQIAQIVCHAVDGIRQGHQFRVAADFHPVFKVAARVIRHGILDFADGVHLAARDQRGKAQAQRQHGERDTQDLPHQIGQIDFQIAHIHVHEHRAHHDATIVNPGHAHRHHAFPQIGKQVGRADFLPRAQLCQLLGKFFAGNHGFQIVPAFILQLEHGERAVVRRSPAHQPHNAVVFFINVRDTAADQRAEREVEAHIIDIVGFFHEVGDTAQLGQNFLFVGFLPLPVQNRGHNQGHKQYGGQNARRNRPEEAFKQGVRVRAFRHFRYLTSNL